MDWQIKIFKKSHVIRAKQFTVKRVNVSDAKWCATVQEGIHTGNFSDTLWLLFLNTFWRPCRLLIKSQKSHCTNVLLACYAFYNFLRSSSGVRLVGNVAANQFVENAGSRLLKHHDVMIPFRINIDHKVFLRATLLTLSNDFHLLIPSISFFSRFEQREQPVRRVRRADWSSDPAVSAMATIQTPEPGHSLEQGPLEHSRWPWTFAVALNIRSGLAHSRWPWTFTVALNIRSGLEHSRWPWTFAVASCCRNRNCEGMRQQFVSAHHYPIEKRLSCYSADLYCLKSLINVCSLSWLTSLNKYWLFYR